MLNQDEGTKKKLQKELQQALGFDEVDEIVSYIFANFSSPPEIQQYLTELLAMPEDQAHTIASRLFPKPKKTKSAICQTTCASATSSPLVPQPNLPNSRLKQARNVGNVAGSKRPEVLHARIVNCLRCGKVETNASRNCSFCEQELHYEALEEDAILGLCHVAPEDTFLKQQHASNDTTQQLVSSTRNHLLAKQAVELYEVTLSLMNDQQAPRRRRKNQTGAANRVR